MNTIVRYIITGISMIALHSCVSVEAYQKAYINANMKLDARKVEYYEIGIENYARFIGSKWRERRRRMRLQ